MRTETLPPGETAPWVTIVIPCYRQAEYLPFAVSSVALQTLRCWEIVVVDDGSPDDTSSVAKALAARLPGRLRLVRQENAGLAAARNAGFAAARTPLVVPLDCDDALDEAFLAATVGALDANPAAAVAYTDVACFGKVSGVWPPRGPLEAAALAEENRLPCCALVRKSAWEAAGGYNPNMVLGYEDWDFWLSLAERGLTGVHVPRPLFLYRVRDESMAKNALRNDRALRARIVLDHPPLYGAAKRDEAERTLASNPLPVRRGSTPPPAPSLAGPLVSVFVPVYNGARYVGETLASLVAQTFESLEIVVCDDGSTDVTREVVKEFAQRDDRVRLLCLPHRGEIAARNAGIAAAAPSARFLMNHDADDISLPTKLASLVAHLDGHRELAGVGCRATYFDDRGRNRGEPAIELEPDRVRATFGRVNSMIHSATLVRRELFGRLGGYREEFRTVEDYDLYARALMQGMHLANIPEVLHRIRIHPESISAKRAAAQQAAAERVRKSYREERTSSLPAPPRTLVHPPCGNALP